MSRTSLQQWLLADGSFRVAFNLLEAESVRAQFKNLHSWRSEYERTPEWPYLLFCASILAPSDIPAAEEKALRIAQAALTDAECLASERDAALVILDSLSNRRSIELAEERGHVRRNLSDRLGMTQRIDWMRRSFENGIELADGKILQANRFQRRFWQAAADNQWLSVSAPTSAGKSFILAQWLAERFSTKAVSRVIYIAPTRALVQQVEDDLRSILNRASLADVEIRSVPLVSETLRPAREILVFTQERLHYYLQSSPAAPIDALIIDEAHKVGDSHRGILLQDVVERLTALNPGVSVLFTAPLTENPEALLADAPAGVSKAPLRSDDATVNQNLLWLEPDADDRKIFKLLLRRGEASHPLGAFELDKRPATIKARLAALAIAIDAGEGGVLIYANGAARAEDIAEELAKRLPDIRRKRRVRALDELCRLTIHKDYKLREVLRKGVAFHYGNMPLLLRTAIENLFRDGHIRYLICTSTLVEGVNLPCRSILIHAPKKGSVPMAPADFWNLAGRAGRWGKEFQGNVFCVDTQDVDAWGDSLPKTRDKYLVERTTDRLLRDEDRLVAHIAARSPSDRARSDQDLETAVSYLTDIRNRFGTLANAPWKQRIEPVRLARVETVLAEALTDVDLPEAWIPRHAGISPFAMQRMMDWMLDCKQPLERFVPVDPEQDQSWRQYGRIFEMMGHYMTTAFGHGARCHALGILTTDWMLGHPIKRIIDGRVRRAKRKDIKFDLDQTIRATLEDIEQIARFQAPRYLACYSDIARHVLMLKDRMKEAEAIPDLTLSLEFGVRGPVQLGLMALGLSRSTTLAIAGPVALRLRQDELNRLAGEPQLLLAALADLEADALKLPALVDEELRKFQRALGRTA